MSPKREKQIIGSTDKIDLPGFELEDIPCKIDTGAQTSTLHCSNVHLLEKDGEEYLCFKLYDKKFGIHNRKEYRIKEFKVRNVRSSNGILEERYAIKSTVVIFGRKIKTEFTLSFRETMKFPILLGKRLLKGRFLVDVSLNDLNHAQKHAK